MIYLKKSVCLGDPVYFELISGSLRKEKHEHYMFDILLGGSFGELEVKASLYPDGCVDIVYPDFKDSYGYNPVTLFGDIDENDIKEEIADILAEMIFAVGMKPTTAGDKPVKEVISYKWMGNVYNTARNFKSETSWPVNPCYVSG